MNMLQAIKAAQKQDAWVWLRPASMRGEGTAFCVWDGRLCVVPGPKGSEPFAPSSLRILTALDWELVDPSAVNNERRF